MSSNSSNSSTGEGNTKPPPTKQISPAKRWCLTLNNYTQEELNIISSIVPEYCKLAIIYKEVGHTFKTPHLQGYIELKTKMRPKNVFEIERIHWEKSKGNREQNIKYCSKDGDLFINIGCPKPLKDNFKYDMLSDYQREILTLIHTEPDDRKVYWYYDTIGKNGKTTLTRHLLMKYPEKILYLSKGKYADIAYVINNADMDYVDTIIIDLPRNNGNKVSYDAIEAMKNGLILSTKYEGRMKIFNPCHVIIFSNEQPDETALSEDRWIIKCIN